MMPELQTIAYMEGTGKSSGDFSNMDMNFNLKLESYIPICLPTNFRNIAKHVDLGGLRKRGIAPIVYYADIQNTPQKVAFARSVYIKDRAFLRRSLSSTHQGSEHSEKKRERLFFDLSSEVSAHQNTGGMEKLGLGDHEGEITPVGKMQILQVITKPLAPPQERRVTEVPEELQLLQEHPWHDPFPSIAQLEAFPPEYQEATHPAPLPFYSVWGLSNTDVNQHVNMIEYIAGFQNHYTRLLFRLNKPLAQHFIHHAQIIFRKPFFPGQCYAIHGKIGFAGDQTVMLAGFYQADPEGNFDPNPFTFSRMDGSFCLN